MVANMHTLTLVGMRPDKSTHTFYRWAFNGPAAQLAVVAFDKAIGVTEEVTGFESWHLECACKWRSVTALRPSELAGPGFLHLMASRIGGAE